MTTYQNVALTEGNIQLLESVYPKLHSLINRLTPVVSSAILDDLNEISHIMQEAFANRWKEEEDEFDLIYEKLSKIADENNFMTTWSIDEVTPEDMDKPFSKKAVKGITYESWGETQNVEFGSKGKKMTWLDMWKEADKLIRQSGDTDHVFIEDFVEQESGYYDLVTGS